MDDVRTEQELVCITDTALYEVQKLTARRLVLKCLDRSFEEINLTRCSNVILEKIKANDECFKQDKNMIAATLRNGFVSTTSDELKRSILLVVSSLKLKIQFRKSLEGESLEYYRKWIDLEK